MAEVNSTLLIEVALDLANSISSDDRFDRLLTSIRKAINCDAVALLALGDGVLTPLAIQGLVPDTRVWPTFVARPRPCALPRIRLIPTLTMACCLPSRATCRYMPVWVCRSIPTSN